jgi:uncharacterized protein (TIGR03435 family)
MRVALCLTFLTVLTFSQGMKFELSSVRACARAVGPDENNRLTISPSRFAGRHATLRRLISEAYGVQMSQVVGPGWLDESEYDVDARAASEVSREIMRSMLRTLLAERFRLRQHTERRTLRAYELSVAPGGPKLASGGTASPGGFPFQGSMHQLADLIALQLTIPNISDPSRPAIASGTRPIVLDKTGLEGVYEFPVDIQPEPGADLFLLWQRFARERLGLRLESRRGLVPVVVVDHAERHPEAN